MSDFILESPVTSLLFTNFFCTTDIILFAMTFILPVLIILNCSSCVSSNDDGKVSPYDDDGRNGKGSKGKSGNFLSEYEEDDEEEEKYIEGDENKKYIITELSSIPVTFSDDSKMIVEENKIIHNREEEYETCLIGEEMKKVYY